ncbi:MAG: hypothetical protein CMH15_00830 [Mesonia sp.]|uniref:Uncharacterized protein n=1 Tax=Mesonia oceanica TaxID=2687242 RepID=A0AC61YDM3_9FLAO|nr:hypothetical protein [Mesonia sp.]MAQ39595.1 hypothetical protein [Mesonia sp.]MBJ97851.1 hypothetical protein [Flavobacteriaceae bacterium]VVV02350.1 hypothetical protein FVB9532_03649 [Mesonia oceanica]|tara:strand:- start:11730 stop:12197 length:468 start_codon:yes stop_codon:yes gene_type:complete
MYAQKIYSLLEVHLPFHLIKIEFYKKYLFSSLYNVKDMSFFREKELEAVQRKIAVNLQERHYFIRNKWKVLVIGLFVSLTSPFYHTGYKGSGTSALALSDLPYYQLVICIFIGYCSVAIIAHFIFAWQDQRAYKRLKNREQELLRWKEVSKELNY